MARTLPRTFRCALAAAALACALLWPAPAVDAADLAAPGAPDQALAKDQQQLITSWFTLIGEGKPSIAAVAQQLDAHPELAQAWTPTEPGSPWSAPFTALHVAASAENRALCQLLIDHHALLDAERPLCTPPLMWCKPKMGAWLIEKGAHPTVFWYAFANDVAALKAALAKQPELAKARDRQHVSALGWSANGCALEAATALLASGADMEATDDMDMTPLDDALGWDDEASRKPEREKVVDLLVSAGARWDARAAALHGKLAELTQELDRHPELLKKRYGEAATDGELLIHFACTGNHQDCVELLLKRGQDINATDDAGTTPLHQACVHGSTLVGWLLAHGANASLHEKRYGADPKGWAQYFNNKGALAAFDAAAAVAKDAAKAKAAEKATENF